jgi:alkanesulfonate monooxygenase SsuD/methylene tetrahydromethanopterin reductase-like flavin-dependent oxidoreductase (luciferase family)
VELAIGLPSVVPGVTGEQLLESARRAEKAGFSTLGTIDRIVYANYEPMISLAAAAAVTERIKLMTAIAIVPYRVNAGLVAKQAATIHHLSGGRFVFGAAIGARGDDYEGTGVPNEDLGRRFDEMLREIKEVWGGAARGFAGAIGPPVQDNPPPLIIGGQVDAAFRRAAQFGDGWIMGAAPAETFAERKQKLEAAYRDAGRQDKPRAMSLTYFALGDDPEGDVKRSIWDYYSFAGDYADMAAAGTAKGQDEVRERVRAFEEAGCDELVMFPASSDPAQVDMLASAVL